MAIVRSALTILFLTSGLTLAYGQEIEKTDTVKTAAPTQEVVAMPKDSLHQELYLVTPDFEFIPGDETPDLIASRLACLEKSVPLKYNRTVHSFIEYFTVRDREFTKSMLRKKELYFPLFEKYLKKYNLPEELKYLSIIESALNPRAISRAKAVGLWQFMHYTGKHYGLTANAYWDDRMDPEKSTDAACRLLADLYRIHKNWDLALAAYNSGPGTVLKANKRSGYTNDFWQLYQYLPRETRSYVPQFIAIVYAMNYAEAHNLFVPAAESFPKTDTLLVNKPIDVEVLAKLSGSCLEDFRQLNPALRGTVLAPASPWQPLKLGAETKLNLAANRSAILDSAFSSGKRHVAKGGTGEIGRELLQYVVKTGDGLGVIAQKYGVKQEDIRAWNNLKGNLIHPGQRLQIWVKSGISSQTVAAKPAAPNTYTVKEGDSLWVIANRFNGLTIEKIKELNKLDGTSLKPGQKLVLN